jgi:hypothetical protein
MNRTKSNFEATADPVMLDEQALCQHLLIVSNPLKFLYFGLAVEF